MFPKCNVKVVHDFELHPNRRPKVIMQTAAHASGAAYFYNPKSIYLDFSNEKRKVEYLVLCLIVKNMSVESSVV